MTRDTFEERLFGALKWLSVAFFLTITVFPLIYMIGLSFKPIEELLRDPTDILPTWGQFTAFEPYRAIMRSEENGGRGFLKFIINSGIVAIVTVVLTVTLATFAAYAAARLNFFGKRAVSAGILVVYMFPTVVIAIPLFVIFSRIGLRGSLLGLLIVYVAQTVPVALFMLRSYFQTIPASLEEAGLIDGLSRLGVIRRITLPLSAPAVASVALFVFMIAWNEFLFALLFLLDQPGKWTLPLAVQQLDSTEVPRTMLMAGSVIITIPVIFLFFVAERFMSEGLTSGGVKG